MKTNTRSVPCDMLSVSEGLQSIRIFTHRKLICVELGNCGQIHMEFAVFYKALKEMSRNLAGAPQAPSPLSCTDSDDKTPPGALCAIRKEAL